MAHRQLVSRLYYNAHLNIQIRFMDQLKAIAF